jgi:predicted Zn-dependent protease
MKRRQFLVSLFLALPFLNADAGSLEPEALNILRGDNGYDVAQIERWNSLHYRQLLNKGNVMNGWGRKIRDPEVDTALRSIARPLWAASNRNLEWNIVLTDSDKVNACTPGGGLIIVTLGCLNNCQEEVELAGVIAHEIGHIQHRHAIQRFMTMLVQKETGIDHPKKIAASQFNDVSMERLMANTIEIMDSSYGRLKEHQADAFIIRAFLTAGYCPAKASMAFYMLKRVFGNQSPDYCIYSSHPLNDERIRRIEALAATYDDSGICGDSEAFRQLKKFRI